jgi:hypothetical protein
MTNMKMEYERLHRESQIINTLEKEKCEIVV